MVIAKKVLDNLHAKLPLTLPVFLASLGIDDFALETAKLIVAAGLRHAREGAGRDRRRARGAQRHGRDRARRPSRTGLKARAAEITAPARGRRRAGRAERGRGPLRQDASASPARCSRPRKEYEKLVDKHGGTLLSGVTKELNYLVMADPNSGSSKAEKARKYGTECIDEAQFLAIVEQAESAST